MMMIRAEFLVSSVTFLYAFSSDRCGYPSAVACDVACDV